jgi:hypothetical protein
MATLQNKIFDLSNAILSRKFKVLKEILRTGRRLPKYVNQRLCHSHFIVSDWLTHICFLLI